MTVVLFLFEKKRATQMWSIYSVKMVANFETFSISCLPIFSYKQQIILLYTHIQYTHHKYLYHLYAVNYISHLITLQRFFNKQWLIMMLYHLIKWKCAHVIFIFIQYKRTKRTCHYCYYDYSRLLCSARNSLMSQ